MSITNPEDRDRVRRFWQAPTMAAKPGLKAVDMFKAVADGRIKALWIMATNPVVSMPDADVVKAAIKACPFVVVSDIVKATDTTRYAHVLFPSLGWGEKDGTVTNSERRISRQRPFLAPPGEARADWWQMAEVARRMGFADAFAYRNPADIFAEHAALSAFENDGRRDFDISAYRNIDSAEYQRLMPFQWPRPPGSPVETKRFFANGGFFHTDGRARFVALQVPFTDRTRKDYPFTLNTGRIRDQWHTMSRTGKSARLNTHIAEPYAEIHPRDAMEIGVREAELVAIESPQGRVFLRALVTPRQARGSVFAPMHWNDQFSAKARIDTLVPPIADPISGQPASKNVAVAIRAHRPRLYGFAVSASQPMELDCAYWALAKADCGWRLELGFDTAVDDWLAWCRRTFDINEDIEPLGYADRQAGDLRFAFFACDQLRAALFLSPEPVAVARNWAISQLRTSFDDIRSRLSIVAGRPGAGRSDPGATVCSCFGVGVNQIVAAVRGGCRSVAAVGQSLDAGTNCGSCRAEIRGIIDGCLATAAE